MYAVNPLHFLFVAYRFSKSQFEFYIPPVKMNKRKSSIGYKNSTMKMLYLIVPLKTLYTESMSSFLCVFNRGLTPDKSSNV